MLDDFIDVDSTKEEQEAPRMTDKITVSKEALLRNFEMLLTDLTELQEQADDLDAKIAELSERVNRLLEYVEGL